MLRGHTLGYSSLIGVLYMKSYRTRYLALKVFDEGDYVPEDGTVANQFGKAHDQPDGLHKFPRLIFLDTNIVQNLHSFGDFIYDRRFSPEVESKLKGKGPW